MGLDNGIYITYDITLQDDKKRLYPPSVISYNKWGFYIEKSDDGKMYFCVELVYWRKWWGVRNEILGRLSNQFNQEYHIPLTVVDIYEIIEVLRQFDNKETWESEGMSIWDYEDNNIHEKIENDIETLQQLISLMKENDPRVKEIYFYDSY